MCCAFMKLVLTRFLKQLTISRVPNHSEQKKPTDKLLELVCQKVISHNED